MKHIKLALLVLVVIAVVSATYWYRTTSRPVLTGQEMVLEIEREKLCKIRDTRADIVAEPRFLTDNKKVDCCNINCRLRAAAGMA